MTQPPKDPANAGESDELRKAPFKVGDHVIAKGNYWDEQLGEFAYTGAQVVQQIQETICNHSGWLVKVDHEKDEWIDSSWFNLVEPKPPVQGDDWLEQLFDEHTVALTSYTITMPDGSPAKVTDHDTVVVNALELKSAIQAQVDANYYPKSKLADTIVKNPETVDRLIAGESLYTQAQVDAAYQRGREDERKK